MEEITRRMNPEEPVTMHAAGDSSSLGMQEKAVRPVDVEACAQGSGARLAGVRAPLVPTPCQPPPPPQREPPLRIWCPGIL